MGIVKDGWIGGISPLDGQLLAPVSVSSYSQIQLVVQQAREAQVEWSKLAINERARILKAAGKHLMRQADRLSEVLHRELGKPVVETYAVDMASAPQVFAYYSRHSARLLKSEPVHFNPVMFPAKQAHLDRLPHGVVALLTPWNYPVSIPLHNLVPALIAGNAVVLKPSEYAARSGALLHELLAVHLPDGLLGLVQGDHQAGECLVRAEIDHVVFVGGVVGGRAVSQAASARLTPVSLELGGKDAAIVLEDADLDRAAYGIAWAGFVNAGQSCAGVERVYVVEAVAEEFTKRLTTLAGQFRLGDDQADPGQVDLGPLSTPGQLEIVKAQVEEALADGARLAGPVSASPAGAGLFYPPTVLTNVNQTMRIMQEETFGPVIPIQVVADEEAALCEANRGDYGLTGSVWTADLRRGERLAARLQVGVATVNNHMFSGAAPQAAWSGRGMSGYGVQNSKLALYSLTRPRLIAVDGHRTPRELWWLPYDKALHNLGRGMLVTQSGPGRQPLVWLTAYFKMLQGVATRLRWQRRRK